jgi:hypothetical protein
MYELKLTADDIRILSNALILLPYGEVAGLINKINDQINDDDDAD